MSKRKEECPLEIRDEDYLEHYGRKGMKWYQHIFGKEASANRAKKKRVKAMQKGKKKAAAARKKKAEEEKKAAAKKQAILRSPSKLYKNRYDFSQEEINAALKNFEWEKKLNDYSAARIEVAAKQAQNFIKLAGSGIAGYNYIASVYNAFNEDNPIPKINLGSDKKK